MKKKLIIFILFIFSFVSIKVQAQSSYVGVKSGVNIPTVFFTDFVSNPRVRTGYFTSPYIAVTYRYMHQPKIGIQLDLAYSSKGWQQNTIEFTNSFRTEINYIEMPVYMHWAIIGNNRLKFNVDVGFYLAYAISTKKTIQNNADLEEDFLHYNLKNDNRGDFGIHAGLSLSYDFSFGTIQLEAAYNIGFANILPRNHIKKENPAVSSNQVPAVNISYLIPLTQLTKRKKSKE